MRVTTPDGAGEAGQRLLHFLAAERHGSMDWLERKAAERVDPRWASFHAPYSEHPATSTT